MFLDSIDIKHYTPNLADAILANEAIANNYSDLTLRKLFTQLYPINTSIEAVLIKCATLNQLYSTHVLAITTMAEHILSIKDIDSRLTAGDITLIDEIAHIPTIKNKFLSFATKYCAMHQPKLFSIYDSNVHKVLKHYHKRKYTDDSLKNYKTYCQALSEFKSQYCLDKLDAWQLDKYLWQLGKELR